LPQVWTSPVRSPDHGYADMTGLVDTYGVASPTHGANSAYGPHHNIKLQSPENKGIWLATDYEWTAGTFAPDPPGSPTLDLDDKFILQKQGGQGEGAYNLPSVPPGPGNNHRIWFDRDGVDQWQAQSPLAVNGGTYNTNGIYQMTLDLSSTSATSGEGYLSINASAGLRGGRKLEHDGVVSSRDDLWRRHDANAGLLRDLWLWCNA